MYPGVAKRLRKILKTSGDPGVPQGCQRLGVPAIALRCLGRFCISSGPVEAHKGTKLLGVPGGP